MITLKNLGVAYRKAKVDLYYSSNSSMSAIADYEDDLEYNLSSLLEKIQGEDESWVSHADFIGGWLLAPKVVDMAVIDLHQDTKNDRLRFSSLDEDWAYICSQVDENEQLKRPEAIFRLMAKCSIDFHVLSTLWMIEVGVLFDGQLSGSAYGNRLRRGQDGALNSCSLGTFQPYHKPFRDWRDHGISAMRTSLDAGRKIVAITADVSSFYHKLNPEFMLDSAFVSGVMGLELTSAQVKLNRLFIQALKAWASITPMKEGLPVGLPASAVLANVALIELDRVIERQIAPIYYGRYVDDILLVMDNGANFRSIFEIWEWIFSRSNGVLGWVIGDNQKQVGFSPSYLNNSDIRFSNAKNKVFMLKGESGKTFVDAIAHQIYERASEWRAMPRLSREARFVGTDLLAATQRNGETAENLREADILTIRRAGFAIKLRDYEAYERDLLPEAWKSHRRAFLSAFVQYILVLPQFFDLAGYLPRVIRLATACEDFEDLRKILRKLDDLFLQLREHCSLSIKSCPEEGKLLDSQILECWKSHLLEMVRESICMAFPPHLSKAGKAAWLTHMEDYFPAPSIGAAANKLFSYKRFQNEQLRLFSFDLAHMPFRFIGLHKEMVAQRGIPSKSTIRFCRAGSNLLPSSILQGTCYLARWIEAKGTGVPYGLLFPTRPYNFQELCILNKGAFDATQSEAMQAVLLAVRGFKLDGVPVFDKHGVLQIPDGSQQRKYGIVVSSWKTKMDSWTASVCRKPDPDVERYARLCQLLDGVISQPQRSSYLVLPELALPAHWFIRIASKLQRRGISLIAGIEYVHARNKRVHNQVWAALLQDGRDFSSMLIYRQDKQRPAFNEEKELYQHAGLQLKPDKQWKTPPIIQHGGLRFALLVCSELTNISYRASLRGKIDALFVPEWNQDTGTFDALVESAALDIHAYIIQCNDRQYGDSRIRSPAKNSWDRDVLRVKGGVSDYCVIGEIDVLALRQFQSNYRSPAMPFKPVPDGFEVDHSRKVLPVEEGR